MALLVPESVYGEMLAMLRDWQASNGGDTRRGGWNPLTKSTPTAPPVVILEITAATSEVSNQRWKYTAKQVDGKLTATKDFTPVGSDVSLRNLHEWQAKGIYTDTSVTGLKPLPVGLQVLATLRTDSDDTACYVCSFPNEPLITC